MRTALEFDDIDPAGAESYRPRGRDRRGRKQTPPRNTILSTVRTECSSDAAPSRAWCPSKHDLASQLHKQFGLSVWDGRKDHLER
jgi:hypothetical protein